MQVFIEAWHLKNRLLMKATVLIGWKIKKKNQEKQKTNQKNKKNPKTYCKYLSMIQEKRPLLTLLIYPLPTASHTHLPIISVHLCSDLLCWTEHYIVYHVTATDWTWPVIWKNKDFACSRVNEVTDASGEPNTSRRWLQASDVKALVFV